MAPLHFWRSLVIHCSAWNKYFAIAGHCVRQSALRAGRSRFVSVFCIWYTIEIWKPASHCDRQKTNPVGHTWNCAGQWTMTGGYFLHCPCVFCSCLTHSVRKVSIKPSTKCTCNFFNVVAYFSLKRSFKYLVYLLLTFDQKFFKLMTVSTA